MVSRFDGLMSSCYLAEIANTLAIYTHIKEGSHTADVIAENIRQLDAPLEELITDFYEPSKNPLAQEVLRLRRSERVQSE